MKQQPREWFHKPAIAKFSAIWTLASHPTPDPIQPDLNDLSLEEVRRYRYHRRIERNSKLAREAKRIHGYTCQVCQFNFEVRYGELGHEYIEAHHLTPLAELPIGQALRLSPRDDFAVVCANCHRMIHRSGAPQTFDEFTRRYDRQPDQL